ncbi:MAG: BrnA antitoxin family protein [Novosphingobium sp.]
MVEIKPELDDDWFAEADAFVGTKLVRRGRPKSDNPKQPVSLRLDREVIDWFKRQGAGWQSRINDELRKAAGL